MILFQMNFLCVMHLQLKNVIVNAIHMLDIRYTAGRGLRYDVTMNPIPVPVAHHIMLHRPRWIAEEATTKNENRAAAVDLS